MTASGVIPHHAPPSAFLNCGAHSTARTADGNEHDLFCELPPGHPGAHRTTVVIGWDRRTVPP